MKIAIFLPDLQGGGAEKIMVEYANFLITNTADEIVFIVGKKKGPYIPLLNSRIDVIDLGQQKTFLTVFPLYAHLRNNRVDVLYTTLMRANLICIIVGSLLKIKIIIREANTLEVFSKQKNKTRSSKISLLLARHIYKYTNKCIAISNFVKKDLVAFTNCDPQKIEVIYNPVIIIDNLPAVTLDLDYFHIGLVSRLTTQKNIPAICKVIEWFIDKPVKIKFHFFGLGDAVSLINDVLSKHSNNDIVELHGFEISYYSYIKHMQLFMHIPLWEGLGNSVLEVFNSGIPMILSDIDAGYSELIKKEYPNIHYFDPVTQTAQIAQLIELYMDKAVTVVPDRIKLDITVNDTFSGYRFLMG